MHLTTTCQKNSFVDTEAKNREGVFRRVGVVGVGYETYTVILIYVCYDSVIYK